MKISDKGIKLKAYKCQAGIWTIGVGHTGKEYIMPNESGYSNSGYISYIMSEL